MIETNFSRVCRRLAVATLVDASGNGFFISGSAAFFVVHLGFPAEQVGIGLSLAAGMGTVASIVIGRLTDRYGARTVYVVLAVAQGLCYACYPLVGSFWALLVVVSLAAIADFGSAPAWGSLVGGNVPNDQRVRIRARLRTVYNIGFSVGVLLCGVVVAVGTPAAYVSLALGNATSFLVGAAVARRVPEVRIPARSSGPLRVALRDTPFLAVTLVWAVLSLHISVMLVAIPLWIVERIDGLGSMMVSVLFVLNTAMAILLQVWASRGAETWSGSAKTARRSGLLLAAGCVALAITDYIGTVFAVSLLVLATVLVTFSELFRSASSWGVVYALAPDGKLGEYLGVFGLSTSIQAMAGPGLITLLVAAFGGLGWLVVGGVAGAAALLAVPVTTRAAHRSAGEPADRADRGSVR
ncbi:MAG: MFS transporter [Pseudonocardia sp.]